jgi:hypothetical protein
MEFGHCFVYIFLWSKITKISLFGVLLMLGVFVFHDSNIYFS